MPPPAPERKATEQAKPAEVTAEKRADLNVRVRFDRAEYSAGEDIGLQVVVSNAGAAVAPNVRFGYEASNAWLATGADELGGRPSIAPGQTKTIKVVLRPKDFTDTKVPFSVRVGTDGVADPTPGDNSAAGTATVLVRLGSVSGVAFADKNDNGKFDDGEALPSASIIIAGGSPRTERSLYVGADGKFSRAELPAGEYRVTSFYTRDDSVVSPAHSRFVVEPGKNTHLEFPAVAPVSSVLSASVRFDKDSYDAADTVNLDFTLTNRGTKPLSGVVAVCQSFKPEDLTGTGPGWAALFPDGPGVALAPGETKSVRVTDVVPNTQFSYLNVYCEVGDNGRNDSGYVSVLDDARVTGKFGRLGGQVVHGETGLPVSGVTFALVEAATGHAVKEVTTNAKGELDAYSVTGGAYVLKVTGKWKTKDGKDTEVVIEGDGTTTLKLEVVPGPEVPNPARFNPDFTVTATFDKDAYAVDEPIRAKVVVKNVGTGTEPTRVGLRTTYDSGQMHFDRSQFGELANEYTGPKLWPGESRELTLVGELPALLKDGKVWLGLEVKGELDFDYRNNTSLISANVLFQKGAAAVVLYGDRNGNGKRDAGEELPGVEVSVDGGTRPHAYEKATTDAAGKALFRDLPVGTFQVAPKYPAGWNGPKSVLTTINADAESVIEIGANQSATPVQPEAPQPEQPQPGRPGGPAPQTPTGDALAQTGASVLGLLVLGALLVAFGFGAQILTRKRT